jgi:pyruvate formate lyase activating enzyme
MEAVAIPDLTSRQPLPEPRAPLAPCPGLDPLCQERHGHLPLAGDESADSGVVAPEHWPLVTGSVHSETTGAMVDGPGIRHVIFLAGCMMRCAYCHNPDTWHVCNGKLTTAGEVVDTIARNASFLRRQGGVTISGGEPLVQAPFAAAILRGCKELGFHTALDTNGYFGHRMTDAMIQDTDLVLLDIKEWDPSDYRALTGVRLEPTLRFARTLAALERPVWLRYVLVPGLTDNLDHIRSLAEFASDLGNIHRVEVLPFHKMGESKWERLGLPYRLHDTQPPTPELLHVVRQTFADTGLYVPGL